MPRSSVRTVFLVCFIVMLAFADARQPAVALGDGEFVVVGPLLEARGGHTATLLADGRVLVTGGFGPNRAALRSAEVYDPLTRAFSAVGPLREARSLHTATTLPAGDVLIVSGCRGTPAGCNGIPSAERYNPETGKSVPAGLVLLRRWNHTSTRLPDGTVLIAGGSGSGFATAEIYDPVTERFVSAGPLTTGRQAHAAVALPDGRVLLVAGSQAGARPTPTAEIYDPARRTFRALGNYIDAANRTVSLRAASAGVARAAALLPDGRVLIVDGSTYLYFDPGTETFVRSMIEAPSGGEHATVLGGGEVLITLGALDTFGPRPAFAAIIDPNHDSLRVLAAPDGLLSSHSATRLSDGSVLLAGGRNGDSPTNAAFLFIPRPATLPAGGSGGLADEAAPANLRWALVIFMALLVVGLAAATVRRSA